LILCQDHRRNNDIGNACKVIADRPPRFPQHALSIHASEFRDRRNWLELKSKEPAINVPEARQGLNGDGTTRRFLSHSALRDCFASVVSARFLD